MVDARIARSWSTLSSLCREAAVIALLRVVVLAIVATVAAVNCHLCKYDGFLRSHKHDRQGRTIKTVKDS